MGRAIGWILQCVLAFGGTGPLRFRIPGREPATVELRPGAGGGGYAPRALLIDGVRFPIAAFGTDIELPPGEHRLSLEIAQYGRGFMSGLEWTHTLPGLARVEANRRYRVR